MDGKPTMSALSENCKILSILNCSGLSDSPLLRPAIGGERTLQRTENKDLGHQYRKLFSVDHNNHNIQNVISNDEIPEHDTHLYAPRTRHVKILVKFPSAKLCQKKWIQEIRNRSPRIGTRLSSLLFRKASAREGCIILEVDLICRTQDDSEGASCFAPSVDLEVHNEIYQNLEDSDTPGTHDGDEPRACTSHKDVEHVLYTMSLLDLIAQSAPTEPGIEVQQALRGAVASVLSSGSLSGGCTEESVHHERYYRLDNGSWQQLLSAVHHPRRLPVLLLDPSQPRCVLAPCCAPSPPGALVSPPGAAAPSGSRLHVAVCFMRCLVPCVPDFGTAAAAAGVSSDKEGFLNLGEGLRLEAVLCGRRRPLRMTQCDKRRLPESSNMDHPSRVEGMTAAAVPSTQATGVVGVKDSFESLTASVLLEVDVLGDDRDQESDDLCIDIIREVLSQSHNGGLLRLNLWREGSDKHMPLLLSSEQLLLLPQGYEAAAAEISLAVKEAERARRSGAELLDDLGVVVEVACGDVAADLSTPCGTERLGALLSQEGLRLKGCVLEAVGSMEEAPGSKDVIEYFDLPANPSQQRYRSCDIFQGDRISAQRLSDVAEVVELVIGDLFEWALKTRRLGTVELLRYCKSLLKQAKRERKALEAATQAVRYIEGRIHEFPMSSLPGRSLLRSATVNLHAQGCRYSNVVQKAVADDPVKAEAVRKFDRCISALNTHTSKGAVPAAVKKASQGNRTPSEEYHELPPQQNEGLKCSSEQLSQWAGQTMRSAASSSFWQTWSSIYIIMTFFLSISFFLKNGPVALPAFLLWTAPYYPILICCHIHQRTASCTSSASPLLSALNSLTIAWNDSKGCNGVCKEQQLVCKTQAASKNVQLIRKGAQHSSAIHSDKDEAMPGVFTPVFTPVHAWVRGIIVWVTSEDNLGMLLHMYRLMVIGLRAAYPSLLGTSKLVVKSGKWYIIVAKCIMMMVESYDLRAVAAVIALLEVPVFYLAVRQSLEPAAAVRQVFLVATITMLAQGAMALRRRWQKLLLPKDMPVSLDGLLSRVLSESSVLGCNPASRTRGCWEKVEEEEQEDEEGINRGSQKKMMPRKVSHLVKPQSYPVISPSLIPWLVFPVCTVVTCYAAVTISTGPGFLDLSYWNIGAGICLLSSFLLVAMALSWRRTTQHVQHAASQQVDIGCTACC